MHKENKSKKNQNLKTNKKLVYENNIIEYSIIRKKVKNINIRVKQNGQVVISCKNNINHDYIEDILIKKIKWIQNCQNRYNNCVIWFDNTKLEDGQKFLFLGTFFIIKLFQNTNRPFQSINNGFEVFFDEDTICIKLENNRGFKSKFEKWYNSEIKKVFTNILDDVLVKFEKFKIQKPTLIIKSMTSRWGTCNKSKKKITLNKHLIKAPIELIEYVCMHECCHLIHNNHGRDFYVLLTELMPDWKKRKTLLNKF